MQGKLGDETVVISIEVTAGTRPAGTPWVNAMLAKHDRMPTGKLVLVSWSGFTGPALKKVEQQGRQPGADPRQHLRSCRS